MNKKNKVLLIVIPFILLVFGYIGYIEFMGGGSNEPLTAEEVQKIHVKPNKALESYESKLEMKKTISKMEAKLEQEKKSAGDPSSFFDKAAGLKQEEEPIVIEEPEEEIQEIKDEPEVERQIVYVPVKSSEPKEEEVVQPKRRRRTGFNASSSGTGSTVSGNTTKSSITGSGIEAVVLREVKAQSNDVVKLRILEDVQVNGIYIPANTIVDGIATVNSGAGRVYLKVNGFSIDGNHVNQNFEAYSLSGGKGLEVNIDVTKGAGRSVLSDAVNNTGGRIQIPGVKSRTLTNAAEQKVEEPAAVIASGTKVYLK